jgi:hypothetical protein
MVTGEAIGALGMTEPGAGSDAKAIRARGERVGDEYVINGQRVYISNGQFCDIVIVCCKMNPDAGARGLSLIAVSVDHSGFKRVRNLEKTGMKAQDGIVRVNSILADGVPEQAGLPLILLMIHERVRRDSAPKQPILICSDNAHRAHDDPLRHSQNERRRWPGLARRCLGPHRRSPGPQTA